jgi:putative ABC transport system permease protein
MNLTFWLRWSWRDLRARWLQVLAISIIIALGTGVFAGLGGQTVWRLDALDTGVERLNMHDLKMELADGSYVDQMEFLAALDGIDGIQGIETRLNVPTLLDASTEDDLVLAQGQLVGVDVNGNGPQIDKLYAEEGRILNAGDAGQYVAMLETKFANANNQEMGATLRISGDIELETIGIGQSPEYFWIIPPDTGLTVTEGNFAIIFVPLSTAQQIADRPGLINDVAFDLVDGADVERVQADIAIRMAESFPAMGIDFMTQDDDAGLKLLYDAPSNIFCGWHKLPLQTLKSTGYATSDHGRQTH